MQKHFTTAENSVKNSTVILFSLLNVDWEITNIKLEEI